MDIILEQRKLEYEDIFVSTKFEGLAADQWCFGYVILYLPKEFKDAKRRTTHFKEISSFKDYPGGYTGGWEFQSFALEAGIKYAKENLL